MDNTEILSKNTMDNIILSPMMIKKTYPFFRLKSLVENYVPPLTIKNKQFPIDFEATNKKTWLYNFGYQYNLQSNVPSVVG